MLPTVGTVDSVLTSFDAVTIKACFMPKTDFHFPSTGARSAELLAAGWGRTAQLSPAGPDKTFSSAVHPSGSQALLASSAVVK